MKITIVGYKNLEYTQVKLNLIDALNIYQKYTTHSDGEKAIAMAVGLDPDRPYEIYWERRRGRSFMIPMIDTGTDYASYLSWYDKKIGRRREICLPHKMRKKRVIFFPKIVINRLWVEVSAQYTILEKIEYEVLKRLGYSNLTYKYFKARGKL